MTHKPSNHQLGKIGEQKTHAPADEEQQEAVRANAHEVGPNKASVWGRRRKRKRGKREGPGDDFLALRRPGALDHQQLPDSCNIACRSQPGERELGAGRREAVDCVLLPRRASGNTMTRARRPVVLTVCQGEEPNQCTDGGWMDAWIDGWMGPVFVRATE